MSRPLEDYALIGDTHTVALVAIDGDIDWLCVPRFDSGAVLASLLGAEEHGRWSLHPVSATGRPTRSYRGETLVLDTVHETPTGRVRVTDLMPHRKHHPTMIRMVEGLSGSVEMAMSLRLRFDYGWVVPAVWETADGMRAVAGPDALVLRTPVALQAGPDATTARFSVGAGERVPFVLAWHDPTAEVPKPFDVDEAVQRCVDTWQRWSSQCTYKGPYRAEVLRSLLTLKALTFAPSGGIVAAPTTSLPEAIGGTRNWDYRYTWLRDASFTLDALMVNGFLDEAQAWRQWLLRAVAGDPSQLQIMYGITGERRLSELELSWLPGYESSAPVRLGNGAAQQLQLDVYGEVLDMLSRSRQHGLCELGETWSIEQQFADWVADNWHRPDEGIWEVRGGAWHFLYSKLLCWVALNRAAAHAEAVGQHNDAERWCTTADAIRAEIEARAFNPDLGSFVQSYDSVTLDASALQIPLLGFLPADDPRVLGTIDAIGEHLTRDGFVLRYDPGVGVDGLVGSEGSFLLCSFWLVQALAMAGRREQAVALFDRLLALANDVGLLAEEYDACAGRMLGNYPQAFSHVGVVLAALALQDGAAAPH